MNELETIARAKTYIDKLANGINPLDNTPVAEGDVINNVRISRCLFFISDTLRRVLENGGISTYQIVRKTEFNITADELEKFKFSDTPISASEIAKRVNVLADTAVSKKFSYKMVTNWLVEIGMLVEMENAEGKKSRYPSLEGVELGIFVDERVGKKGPYKVVIYNKSAQKFIVDNVFAILEHHRRNKS